MIFGPKLPPDPPGWTTEVQYGRILDPIRGAALANAVDLAPAIVAQGNTTSPDEILDWARTFEAYLTGEEANGDT
jgi:hypothetical protein